MRTCTVSCTRSLRWLFKNLRLDFAAQQRIYSIVERQHTAFQRLSSIDEAFPWSMNAGGSCMLSTHVLIISSQRITTRSFVSRFVSLPGNKRQGTKRRWQWMQHWRFECLLEQKESKGQKERRRYLSGRRGGGRGLPLCWTSSSGDKIDKGTLRRDRRHAASLRFHDLSSSAKNQAPHVV